MVMTDPLRPSGNLKSLQRRHSAPYLLTAANSLAGAGRSWRGSKFWVLDDENSVSSDDETDGGKEDDLGDSEWGSDRKFIRDAS